MTAVPLSDEQHTAIRQRVAELAAVQLDIVSHRHMERGCRCLSCDITTGYLTPCSRRPTSRPPSDRRAAAQARRRRHHPLLRSNTMSIWNSAVLLYGIPLPDDHDAAGWAGEELRDAILAHHDGVSHASAGPYDRHTTYLCTDYADADMGQTETIPAPDPTGQAERDARLHHVCLELDFADHPAPAWHLIASQS